MSSTNQPKDASRGYTHHERNFKNAHVANTQGSMTGFEVPKLDFANVRRSFGSEQNTLIFLDFRIGPKMRAEVTRITDAALRTRMLQNTRQNEWF